MVFNNNKIDPETSKYSLESQATSSAGTHQSEAPSGKRNLDKIYIGTVISNKDKEFMGRLEVHIPEMKGDPTNSSATYTINYCSPFAGTSKRYNEDGSISLTKDGKEYTDTEKSYGFWAIPPVARQEVVVAFANGDPTRGIFLGCLYQKDMNYMIPGIASGGVDGTEGKCDGSKRGYEKQDPPISEYNRYSDEKKSDTSSIDRPEYKPLHEGMATQGLICDVVRGISTSSARRESPSKVIGLLTPAGTQFIMDDGSDEDNGGEGGESYQWDNDLDKNQFIRLRTKTGAQVLINETYGNVYMISKEGENWLELMNNGRIDIFASNKISIHTEEDFNLVSEKTINIEAKNNINIKTKDGWFCADIKTDTDWTCRDGHFYTKCKEDWSVKCDAVAYIQTSDEQHYKAGGNINMDGGSDINLNCGKSKDAKKAEKLKDNDLSKQNEDYKKSICTRVPEHEPWLGHKLADGEEAPEVDKDAEKTEKEG